MEETKIDKKGIPVSAEEWTELEKIRKLMDHYNEKLFHEIYHRYNYKRNPRNRIGEFKVEGAIRRDDEGLLMVDISLCSASKVLHAGFCVVDEKEVKELLKDFLITMCISGIRPLFQKGATLDDDAI